MLADACESSEWAWILSRVGSREIRRNQNAQVGILYVYKYIYTRIYVCNCIEGVY